MRLDDSAALGWRVTPAHRDPFDCVIVALGLAHGPGVLISDENIAGYPGVKTAW